MLTAGDERTVNANAYVSHAPRLFAEWTTIDPWIAPGDPSTAAKAMKRPIQVPLETVPWAPRPAKTQIPELMWIDTQVVPLAKVGVPAASSRRPWVANRQVPDVDGVWRFDPGVPAGGASCMAGVVLGQ